MGGPTPPSGGGVTGSPRSVRPARWQRRRARSAMRCSASPPPFRSRRGRGGAQTVPSPAESRALDVESVYSEDPAGDARIPRHIGSGNAAPAAE